VPEENVQPSFPYFAAPSCELVCFEVFGQPANPGTEMGCIQWPERRVEKSKRIH